MISGIASMLGIGSPQAEITDDEASDVGEASPAPATIKQEKKAKEPAKTKEKAKPTIVEKEKEEESLMVESEKDEGEEEDDDEVGPDEYVLIHFTRQFLLTSFSAGTSLSLSEVISLMRMSVSSPSTHPTRDSNINTDGRAEIRGQMGGL
jgi:hypothetical protein